MSEKQEYQRMNPGIRETVRLLLDHGYDTTDSGDGVTHDCECDRDYGYVVVVVEPENLTRASHGIKDLLESRGARVSQMAMERGEGDGCHISASYCPITEVAVIDVSYITDKLWSEG